MKEGKKTNRNRKYRWLRQLGRVFTVLLLIFIGIILFIRSPWGQELIVSKAVKYVSNKTNTDFRIDRLFITFSGNISVKGLFLADKKGDTLVYSRSLEANIALRPILFGNELRIKSARWDGLTANIYREAESESFNFDFLIEAFSVKETVTTAKDTTSINLNLGSLDFTDFKIEYNDAYLGIDSHVILGKLSLDTRKIDMATMRFEVEDLKLFDSEISYKQTKNFSKANNTIASQLPYLAIGNLQFQNVKATYSNEIDHSVANILIGDFISQIPKIDLSQNDFEITSLNLSDSAIFIKKVQDTIPIHEPNSIPTDTNAFEWPNYQLKSNSISLQNNNLEYRLENAGSSKPLAASKSLSNINLEAKNLSYENKKVSLNLTEFYFNDKDGFHLNNLSFDAEVGDTSTSISKLNAVTGNSSLNGFLNLHYHSIDSFLTTPEKTSIAVNIPALQLSLEDVFAYFPNLENNPYLAKASQKIFSGKLGANGTLNEIKLTDINVAWGDYSSLSANATLKNVTIPDSLYFDVKDMNLLSKRKDLLYFIAESDLGITFPETIHLKASANGKLSELHANVVLQIPEGRAQLVGEFSNREKSKFQGNLRVDSLQLGHILKNSELGAISFTVEAFGEGFSINTLNAGLKSDFTKLEYSNYDFANLKLEGAFKDGAGNINLGFKDKNLNLNGTASVSLDSMRSKIQMVLNLKGADLYALGISQENIKTAVDLNVDFIGNFKNYSVKARLSNGVAISKNQQFQMEDLQMDAEIGSKTTDIKITSGFLNAELKSNAAPKPLTEALQQHFKNYFDTEFTKTVSPDSVKLNMNLNLRPTPILTQVVFNGLEKMDTITSSIDFNEVNHTLKAYLALPSLTYGDSKVDSLNFYIKSDASTMDFGLSIASVTSDPLYIDKTQVTGKLRDQKMNIDFTAFEKKEILAHIASEITFANDTVSLHINPEKLHFNKQKWSIPNENGIVIANKYLGFNNFILSKNEQEILLSNTLPNIEKEHVGVSFKNFQLQTFFSLFNPDKDLANGSVLGNLILENPYGASGLIAELKVNGLQIMEQHLGSLELRAATKQLRTYDFDLSVKDGGLDMDLIGDYNAAAEGAELNLDFSLNKLDLKLIQAVSKGVLKEASGSVSGKFKVTGTSAIPEYAGKLNFDTAEFNVASLNSTFKISEETIRTDTKGLYFDTFKIFDANNNSFILDGNLGTETVMNPTFDLKLVAKKFQVLNSKETDNKLFYGNANIDSEIKIKGNLNLPKINGRLKVGNGTNVTYVVPESQLDVQERDGVVVFVNRENPDDILTRNDKEETSSLFKGYDVNTILEVSDDAIFNIIIDKRAGDNLKVAGNAALSLNIVPNGTVALSGRYELTSGHYETNLYNLVKRKFNINTGSTITWLGNPTDAVLDVTAVYEVETSSAPLMASVTSALDASATDKYRQVLPFLVYLNVDGRILEPKLSFGLGMPEDQQGSLGGAVYGRVQQLNEQESELNKQVFSLLALNRFFPDSGNDGSSGGATSIARNNVNRLLSDELNVFANKVLGKTGFEVDFGLESFMDYQGNTPQDRTQLNINAKKKIMNDRLIVTAGSSVDVEGSAQAGEDQTPIIGNVSLEYLLNENGRWRLKGFRKNQFENVIDGQLVLTGFAFIFNQEFNRLSELFKPVEKNEQPIDSLQEKKGNSKAPDKELKKDSSNLKKR